MDDETTLVFGAGEVSRDAARAQTTTDRLDNPSLGFGSAHRGGHRYDDPDGELFTIVPVALAQTALPPDAPRWQVELAFDDPQRAPLRLEVVGDTILGRSAGADVNFEGHGGSKKGVSRRHAMLRPSRKALFLLDLESTNGTIFNGVALGGTAAPLIEGGLISLGKLSLMVRMVRPVQPG